MCVKSVELTCTRSYTKTHDIRSIIVSLPDMDIKEDLLVAWRENVPNILKTYSDMMYKGLNRYTGDIDTMAVSSKLQLTQFQAKTQENFLNSKKSKFWKASSRLRETLLIFVKIIFSSLKITAE